MEPFGGHIPLPEYVTVFPSIRLRDQLVVHKKVHKSANMRHQGYGAYRCYWKCVHKNCVGSCVTFKFADSEDLTPEQLNVTNNPFPNYDLQDFVYDRHTCDGKNC